MDIADIDAAKMVAGLKTTETLLGIETLKRITNFILMSGCLKTTETLLGIETTSLNLGKMNLKSLKTTETLLGIETAIYQLVFVATL